MRSVDYDRVPGKSRLKRVDGASSHAGVHVGYVCGHSQSATVLRYVEPVARSTGIIPSPANVYLLNYSRTHAINADCDVE